MVKVPGPPTGPDSPDEYTASAPDYSADGHAAHRVFHIDTKWFRYGTNDRAHASALILSLLLLVSSLAIAAIGSISIVTGHDPKWLEMLIGWIGNAFLFTAGIAVGKGSSDNKKLK
jgi:hypothetical protein